MSVLQGHFPATNPRNITWHLKGRTIPVNGVMGAFILLFAIITVLAFGIGTAYALIIGILHSLAPRSESAVSATRILVPSQTHAGGD